MFPLPLKSHRSLELQPVQAENLQNCPILQTPHARIALHQYKIPEASVSLLLAIPQQLQIAGPYMIFKCAHFIIVRNFVLISYVMFGIPTFLLDFHFGGGVISLDQT